MKCAIKLYQQQCADSMNPHNPPLQRMAAAEFDVGQKK